MKRQVVVRPGEGRNYRWSQDHVYVKAAVDLGDGRVTVVEDVLAPGFRLARHHHKRMLEIFYVLEGDVVFAFDDERVVATPGTTVSVPPEVRHEVTSPEGARLLTIFSPGGFDSYLEELVALTESQYADAGFMQALAERYDIFDG